MNWTGIAHVTGYVVGAWFGLAVATAGVICAGLGRIDRLAAQQERDRLCRWDPWAEFDRVAAEKGEVW